MRKFSVSCVVDESKIASIFSLLVGDAENLEIREVREPAPRPARPENPASMFSPELLDSPMRGKITLTDMVMQMLQQGGDIPVGDIRSRAVAAGFSETSVSPLLNELQRDKKIERTSQGVYRWRKETIDDALGKTLSYIRK